MIDKWNDDVFCRLVEVTKRDQYYQELLSHCIRLEDTYCGIMERLVEED